MLHVTSGIILINKPRGITSHDVVERVRNLLSHASYTTKTKPKVGHAGTLDPLAEGLLIVLVGDATKKQATFMAGEKEYIATIHLGASSSTDDAEGTIEPLPHPPHPTRDDICRTLANFVGEITQVPPAYSAVRVGGKKAYELARRGETPTLTPRRVTITKLELMSYRWPTLTIRVVCSGGTYIRALARDIGKRLHCGAYVEALIRTRSGPFSLDDAIPLASLTEQTLRDHLAKTEEKR
jgi:tRNA pseudouridine55 synthase